MTSFLLTVPLEHIDPRQFWGIPVALVGALLLSFGAQYQSRGLNKVERLTGQSASAGLNFRQIVGLLRRPSWVIGTSLLGLATLFQIVSLSLSPIIVVQPIGVVALISTAILNSKFSKLDLGMKAKVAIALSVIGVTAFVTVAAFTATDRRVTDEKLLTILITFATVFALACLLFILFRHRAVALIYIIGAGVLYGFVATFAKIVIGRFQQDDFDWLTWLCVIALLAGALLGLLFVQNAYSSGPPDLVVAGLTVIDPIVAVIIGIVVLGEAANASMGAIIVFGLSAVVAILGVYRLAKHHPQTGMNSLLATSTGQIRLPVIESDHETGD